MEHLAARQLAMLSTTWRPTTTHSNANATPIPSSSERQDSTDVSDRACVRGRAWLQPLQQSRAEAVSPERLDSVLVECRGVETE